MRSEEGDRLPPGQVTTSKFPVLHIDDIPPFNAETWRLRVKGEVGRPLELTYDDFLALPRTVGTSDFHCVTRWSRFDNRWEGVLFRDLAALAQVKPEAKFVSIEAEHGYHTNLPLDIAMGDDVLLAYGHDDAELAPEHGFPLRLVVPGRYAYKSAKWVRVIRFLLTDEPGYWERRGYSNSADPWREERLTADD